MKAKTFSPGDKVRLSKHHIVNTTTSDIPNLMSIGNVFVISEYTNFKYGEWFVSLLGVSGSYQESLFTHVRPRLNKKIEFVTSTKN